MPEFVTKIRLSQLGRHHTPEAIEKIRTAATGRHQFPESIEKLRVANLGKHLTQETKEKIRAGNLGKHSTERNRTTHLKENLSPETIENYRIANLRPEVIEKRHLAGLGKHHTQEAIEKMRVSQLGKYVSSETREKLRLVQLGRHPSPETRKKLSESAIELHRNGVFDNCYRFPTKIERELYSFLDSFHILHFPKMRISLNNTIRKVDDFLPPNIIIEADGRYHFKQINKCRDFTESRIDYQIERDKETDQELIQMGYIIYRISYLDFNNGKYKEIILKTLKIHSRETVEMKNIPRLH